MDLYVTKFIDYLRYEKRYSSHTVESYQRVLLKAVSALTGDPNQSYDWQNLDFAAVRKIHKAFNFDGNHNKLNNNTVAHDLYALSSFIKFLIKEQILKDNPIKQVQAPKVKRHLPNILSLSEIEFLLDAKCETPQDYRDNTIAELLFSSGLRVSELVNLQLSDLNFELKEVRVLGKGNKQRVVPVGTIALGKLDYYLKQVRDTFNPKDEAVFVSKFGRKMTTRAVEQNLQKLCNKIDLGIHLNPHKLRHSFATEMLQGGADIRAVQEMLGHSSLAATQVYTHLNYEHLKEVYDKAHPLSKKDPN